MLTDSPLPSFANPPVSEVAIVVQFATPHVGLFEAASFMKAVEAEFPVREERPAPPPMAEVFDVTPRGAGIELQMMASPPLPRFWLLSEDKLGLLQLQSDLFALNWRKLDSDEAYPRFPRLRQLFGGHLETLVRIVEEAGGSADDPNWVEVTYVNVIDATGADGGPHSSLGDCLNIVSKPESRGFLPEPEDEQVVRRYRINIDNEPQGRLIVAASPGFRVSDEMPIWELKLTSRIRVQPQAIPTALERIDHAREWVVRAFRELTTEKMHDMWSLETEEGED